MRKLLFKRYYWLFIIFALFIVVGVVFGNLRIISYNFGEGGKYIADVKNIENGTDLFDDSSVHEITITMENGDFETMINTYKETGEKDYFHANITIDGVEVENVGIRLKGNLTLSQSLGTQMNMDGNGNGNGMGMPNGRERPEGFEMPEGFEPPEGVQQRQFAGDPFEGDFEEVEGEPPFLIKFDEFESGQTYQGYTEIALRISSGGDKSLLTEQIAFYIHGQMGQIVPQTSYGYIQTPDEVYTLYEIAEHIDETYIEKHFPGSDTVLYKAGNFVGFEYVGEDPTLYAEKFEQKTSINDDDLNPLIQFLKFVTESSDEEFEENLANWIDLDSFIRMMALDNLLKNNDSFVGMGSNYYLLYDNNTKKFTMLSWDMNLALGSMGMGGGRNGEMPDGFEMPEGFELPEGFEGRGMNGGPGGMNSTNYLKERFFENETFSAMYDEEYVKLEALIFNTNLAVDKIDELTKAFTLFNNENSVMEQIEYDSAVENIRSFFQNPT